MRLTLRTLLAWLDDTLPPSEVRQIGQQVNETPLAQELVQRIQRVTRQRRLTVPPASGHDAVDPNIVADYLGDVLPPDVLTEYEKKCLTSDVHLAEVASVHQILSLLGQKAKVPPEAKQRMYHLVRGRESAAAPAARPAATPPRAPEPVAESPFAPTIPRRSLVERFGAPAFVAGLIFVMGWSAWMSVGGPARPAPGPEGLAPDQANKVATAPRPAPKVVETEKVPPADAEAEAEKAKAEAEAKAKEAPKPEDAPAAPAVAAGSAGVVGPGDGVLLRYNPESRAWDRLVAGATLRDGDRLANLPPFRAALKLGSADVTMVGDGEVTVLSPGAGASSRFALNRGRVRIVGSAAGDPIVVPLGAASLSLTVPAGAVAGLERIATPGPANAPGPVPALRIDSAEGAVTAASGAKTVAVNPGTASAFRAPGEFSDPVAQPTPVWLARASATAAEQDRASRLAKYFRADRPTLLGLVEAVDDDRPEVRRDAVIALGAVGPLDLVASELSRKDDPDRRKAAIQVLREAIFRDADSAKAVRTQLESVGGSKEWADTVEGLLVGPSAREATDEAYQARLAALLKHDDVGVRELAIETLQAISRRADRLGYDPDHPHEGNGLKAWQDLVQRHELRAPAAKAK